MRVAVITDAHANLPALRAALRAIRSEGCDAVFHTGDAVAIGPFPAECVELLLSTPGVRLLAGNHERYLLDGLGPPLPDRMGEGEAEHQRWTHERLGPAHRAAIASWPARLDETFDGTRAVFVHYGSLPDGSGFAPITREASPGALDGLFAGEEAGVVFFGHDHRRVDVAGRGRYVCPGSLGCSAAPVARYAVATFDRGRLTVAHRAVPYDDEPLLAAFEARAVPERSFIRRVFHGGR